MADLKNVVTAAIRTFKNLLAPLLILFFLCKTLALINKYCWLLLLSFFEYKRISKDVYKCNLLLAKLSSSVHKERNVLSVVTKDSSKEKCYLKPTSHIGEIEASS
ncbi:uncharacterized protein RHIMIDRAFT_118172 [Rhizopus microsporus ATCC 52813]|uniref:Uncharacterized protein n=1 Tax=Rhizopus microsporus ATCC 52813 TaxID=1340429 RepID=A0A2G4SEJ3_RHIZD|nr:uncharacterized protein RHIMIDRAFT_118172 [Rhizopus microsporus ATCC 52813]PHZ07210.1 hypothetical protein RHIMIDRAFT_118172 [Rhizopus microsporus ATCC 52813]